MKNKITSCDEQKQDLILTPSHTKRTNDVVKNSPYICLAADISANKIQPLCRPNRNNRPEPPRFPVNNCLLKVPIVMVSSYLTVRTQFESVTQL